MLNGPIDGPSAISLSEYKKTVMPSPHIPNSSSQSLSLSSLCLSPPSQRCLLPLSAVRLLLWWTDNVRLVALPSPSIERVGRWIHTSAPPGWRDPAGRTHSRVDPVSPVPQREVDPRMCCASKNSSFVLGFPSPLSAPSAAVAA
jgi:hypothetical protein